MGRLEKAAKAVTRRCRKCKIFRDQIASQLMEQAKSTREEIVTCSDPVVDGALAVLRKRLEAREKTIRNLHN